MPVLKKILQATARTVAPRVVAPPRTARAADGTTSARAAAAIGSRRSMRNGFLRDGGVRVVEFDTSGGKHTWR